MDLILTDNSNIILFDFYFGKLLKFYILIMFKYSGSYENKLYWYAEWTFNLQWFLKLFL